MLVSDLDYPLPPELIAQAPIEPRDAARLMVLGRGTQSVAHHRFHELPQLLRDGDLLVFNDSKVLRARLRGRRLPGGGAVEALLLREISINRWEALLKPSAKLKTGQTVSFVAPGGGLENEATLEERGPDNWRIAFSGPGDIRDLLPQFGEVPLPPYIHEKAEEARYQTVYAKRSGHSPLNPEIALDSAAAPTAGLHFTPGLLEALAACGIGSCCVTLGIGIGTFRPIQVKNLDEHVMHAEEFEISPEAAEKINAQKRAGGRVVAVGTTAARVLESGWADGALQPGARSTSIFITPGHRFACMDALITNFHLPRSSLLAMVGALAGLETIRYAYRQAVAERYRFFSFGDAMLIE